MILTVHSIELSNFMGHQYEEVEFDDNGVFLLWGRSGGGKSSLLEAIGFALYGVTATRASKLSELRNELHPEKDVEVKLTLNTGDGNKVQIFRGFTPKDTSSSWIVDASGTFHEGNSAVKEQVEILLGGMDGPTLASTYYSKQGELDALITMREGDRRKFVQRMIGVSMLNDLITKLGSKMKEHKIAVETINQQLPDNVDEFTLVLETYQPQIEGLEAKVKSLDIQVQAIEAQGRALKEEFVVLQENYDVFQKTVPLISSLKTVEIPTLEQKCVELEKSFLNAKKAWDSVKKHAGFDDTYLALQKELETLSQAEGALHSLEEKNQLFLEKKEEKNLLAQQISDLHAENPEGLEKELQQLYSYVEEQERQLFALEEQYQEMPEECPTCHRDFDESSREKAREQYRTSKEKIVKDIEQKRSQDIYKKEIILKKSRASWEEKESLLSQDKILSSSLNDLQKQIERASSTANGANMLRLSEVKKEIQKMEPLKNHLLVAQKEASQKETLETQLETSKKDLLLKQTQLVEAEKKITEISFDEKQFRAVENKLEESRENYRQNKDKLSKLQLEVQDKKHRLQTAKKQLENVEQLKEARSEANKQHLGLSRLRESITEFRHNLVGSIRPHLEQLTSFHLSELTDGYMPEVKISEDYELSIKRNGDYRPMKLCSGGEKARVAFSLRLALTQMVSQRTDTPVGFMIFDEIFGSQDEDHRQAILDALLHLKSIYPQVFLISHEESMKDSPLINTLISVPDSPTENRIVIDKRT